jgi:hypothetical protein
VTNWTERVVAGERKRYEYPRYFFSNRSETSCGCASGRWTCSASSTAAPMPGTSRSHDVRRWRSSTSTSARSAERSLPQRSTPSR